MKGHSIQNVPFSFFLKLIITMDTTEEEGRLYVKVKCSVCFGTMSNRNGGACPYCDLQGKTFIEASINVLKETLQAGYTTQEKEEIIKCLTNLKNGKSF